MTNRATWIVIVAIGFTSAVADQADAQQRERLIGGGRIMRKIFGIDDEPAKKPTPSKSKSKQKQPTLAKPKSSSKSKTPSKSTRPSTPTLAPPRNSNSRPATIAKPAQDPFTSSRSRQTRPQNDIADQTQTDPKTTLGFGMLVVEQGENLVVRQLDPKGNAAEAGIKRGDLITKGGGVEFGSVEEFNQITEILKDGDQLEFEISRRGKEDKLLIQFGKTPETADQQIAPADSVSLKPTPSLAGPQISSKDHFSFLPTNKERRKTESTENTGLRSVLGNVNDNSFNAPKVNNQLNSDELKRQLQLQRLEIERLRQQLQKRNQSAGNLPTLSGPNR